MNTFNLRAFIQIIECGSVPTAASEISMTRPGISMLLHRLEQQFHAELVERRHGSIMPTPAGLALYHYAKTVVAAEEQLKAQLIRAQELPQGWVRIGASRTMAAHFLPPILSRFKASYPQARVSVENGTMEAVAAMVLEGQVDFAYMMRWPHDELTNTPVRRERVVIIAPPHDLLSQRTSVSKEEILLAPLVMLRNSGLRLVLERALGCSGTTSVTLAAEVGNVEALVEAVRCGLGYGVIFESAVERELRDGRLHEIVVEGLAAGTEFNLVRRTQPPLTAVARALYVAILEAEASASAPVAVPAPRDGVFTRASVGAPGAVPPARGSSVVG